LQDLKKNNRHISTKASKIITQKETLLKYQVILKVNMNISVEILSLKPPYVLTS